MKFVGIVLISLGLLVSVIGCASLATKAEKDRIEQRMTDLAQQEALLKQERQALEESKIKAISDGDEAKVADIETRLQALTGALTGVVDKLDTERTKYVAVSDEEVTQRTQRAQGWINLAMGIAGMLGGGSILGAAPAAKGVSLVRA